ncbi:MAG: VWA domain-containing protein, partial [Actinomycetota bacterium]
SLGALLDGAGTGPAGRRGRLRGRAGHPIDARPAGPRADDLAAVATLRAAAARPQRPVRVHPADLREHVRAGREATLVVLVLDASGSMGARRRMPAVKAAALGLLLDAYQRRDRVALVTFRDARAELTVPPAGGVAHAAAAIRALPTGGTTPLDAGLDAAAALVRRERRREPGRRAVVVVVTDGRTSGGADGLARARAAARRLGRTADAAVVVDAEQGPVRLGLAAQLAEAAGARLTPLAALTPTARRAA